LRPNQNEGEKLSFNVIPFFLVRSARRQKSLRSGRETVLEIRKVVQTKTVSAQFLLWADDYGKRAELD